MYEQNEILDLSGRLEEVLSENERISQLLETTTQENVGLRCLLEELQRELDASEQNKVTMQQQVKMSHKAEHMFTLSAWSSRSD
jgi:regulator of replication initiation timing